LQITLLRITYSLDHSRSEVSFFREITVGDFNAFEISVLLKNGKKVVLHSIAFGHSEVFHIMIESIITDFLIGLLL